MTEGSAGAVPAHLSERMLRELVARADRWLGLLSIGFGVLCLLHATVALIVSGPQAFGLPAVRGWAITGPAATVLAAPVFTLAATSAHRKSTRAAALLCSTGICWLVLTGAVAAGPASALWFVYPLTTLLIALGLGAGPGLAATLVGMAVYAVVALRHGPAALAGAAVWAHVASVTAAYSGTGLLGVWLHGLLRAWLGVESEGEPSAGGAEAAETADRERWLCQVMQGETAGDVAIMVAHRLRNHLQVIVGHVALAATEPALQKDSRLAVIRAEIDASIGLLEQLLSRVHPDEGAVVRVDLAALCAEICDRVRSMLPAAIRFETDLPRQPVPVRLAPGGLEEALLNLVINARHALQAGGRLTVSVSRRGRVAQVQVADNGVGIAARDLPRLFELGFTTKPRGEGTGLGLAAVERYVKASSGTVAVESEPGRGTTFRLEFPLADRATV